MGAAAMTAGRGATCLQAILLLLAWAVTVGLADYQCYYQSYDQKYPADIIRPDVGEFGSILSMNYPNGYGAYRGSCQVHIKACHGCIIKVKFEEGHLAACSHDSVLQSHSATCDQQDLCEYFIWVESGQDAIRLGGNVTAREVSTQEVPLVTLRFCYSANLDRGKNTAHIQRWKAAFAILDMFTYRYSGTAEGSGTAKTSLTFHLQGFPHPYSSKSCTYFIQGMLATDHIRIIFDDFDLDPDTSLLKIYDGPGRVRETTYRTPDERPFFTSSSQNVLIEFLPGVVQPSNIHIGFKATYQFISNDSLSDLPNPVHHKCQPVKPLEGGEVLQAGPAPGSDPIYHDCLWSLRPSPGTYISVHVLKFKVREEPTSPLPLLRQLEIRKSFHSEGEAAIILYSESQLDKSSSNEVSSKQGLYIRLRATLDDKSEVRFSYASYRLVRVDNSQRPSGTPAVPVTRWLPTPCKPAFHRCSDGTCVPTAAHCVPDASCPNQCLSVPDQCYHDTQQCDGRKDCQDGTDELYCNREVGDRSLAIFVRSLGNTWFFFLPAVILVLTFVIGCVIYKTRKFRHLAQAEGYTSSVQGCGTVDIQLHTFTATAPPPYEEVATSTATHPHAAGSEECEAPPAYEEVTRDDTRGLQCTAAPANVALLVRDTGETTANGNVRAETADSNSP